jgi:thioredoxin 1
VILLRFKITIYIFAASFISKSQLINKYTMETAIKQTVHLTTDDFKEKVFNYEANKEWKYEGTLPAIIDFYADWCQPCKMVAPVLEDLAREYAGQIMIYKVNTEEEHELASVFGIQSIPTILFIPKEGQPQAAMGALPKLTFEKAIKDILLKN